MKQLTILLLSALLLSSCTHEANKWVCNTQQKDSVREFVKSSIKNANNMADEEMEDVIYQLEKTGVHLNCKNIPVKYRYDGSESLYDLPDSLSVNDCY